MSADNKILVLFSGGLDSTCLLANCLERSIEGDEVSTISFHYGQRHHREIKAAARILDHYHIPESRRFGIDIRGFDTPGSSQTDLHVAVPEGHYTAENMKLTIVPNRNMIMLSIAAGIALAHNIGYIAYAAHAGDHAIYPDCRPEFVAAMQSALQVAAGESLRAPFIFAPFLGLSKAELLGQSYGYTINSNYRIPLELTYSCYNGREKHCGKCGTCVERKEAFQLAPLKDPTEYED